LGKRLRVFPGPRRSLYLLNSQLRSNIKHQPSDIRDLTSDISAAPGIHQPAEIRKDQKKAIIEGKIMNLSVETKVAIAVATTFIVFIVGAMAQG
jgi:hypothetical protein